MATQARAAAFAVALAFDNANQHQEPIGGPDGFVRILYMAGRFQQVFVFSSPEQAKRWKRKVSQIRSYASYIYYLGIAMQDNGVSDWFDQAATLFGDWLDVVEEFIEEMGTDMVTLDIKSAMKDVEINLERPVTFPDAPDRDFLEG